MILHRRGNIGPQQQLGRSYRRGIRKGLFKIMSKMGISSISSYRGAQLFEIVGLHERDRRRVFQGTTSASRAQISSDLLSDQGLLAATPGTRAELDAGRVAQVRPRW